MLSYLNIFWTDLRQIFTVGRTTAVDYRSEIARSLSIISSEVAAATNLSSELSPDDVQ